MATVARNLVRAEFAVNGNSSIARWIAVNSIGPRCT